jgi:hypothetical protein
MKNVVLNEAMKRKVLKPVLSQGERRTARSDKDR